MIIELALFAALLLFLGLGSWKIDRDVEHKVRRLKTHQEPRIKDQFYCDGKELFFHDAEMAITKKLASLVGSRIIRDGELRFSVVDNQAEEARS